MNSGLLGIGLNTVLVFIAWIAPKKLLTPAGLIHAWFLGAILWLTLGWQGYLLVIFYFLVGSAVTRIGMAEKEALGIAEERSGTRGPGNVWGSAFTGSVCALAVLAVRLFYSTTDGDLKKTIVSLLILGFVASFSTKLSDTSATEVGKAYGKSTYLITTLKPVPRGTEGAVSLEGTIAGIFASAAIAFVGWGIGLIDLIGVLWCTLAAFIATNIESVIGATLESRYDWLTHDVVNILNTSIGAIAAIALALLWKSFS
ncbi:TIGR00297 family protein [Mastigocoleus sp. MO_188.B34]|uniref:TIGR00297 family protein n=1 Tax=Mastigocoleus sp. MO_188.B34 TaxID=3036635 RepID=UPI0026252801|nr:TIGR00297 family protein [Mastigocoleus sp. MO_188.B34]MDJ0695901.1 TIGR00297 family protein [Mastigocoleus sp. MO_188.B34]